MNRRELTELQHALTAVHDAVGRLTWPRCDRDEVFELIDRLQAELAARHPNIHRLGMWLDSIAHSLRAQPATREACQRLAAASERLGLTHTRQNGI